MATETHLIVHSALIYSDKILPVIADRVLDGMHHKTLNRNVLTDMRSYLSVPAMFAVLRVMRRVQTYLKEASDSVDAGELVGSIKLGKKGSVDHTTNAIWENLCKHVSRKTRDSINIAANPYKDIMYNLDEIILYVAKKQFGVKFSSKT